MIANVLLTRRVGPSYTRLDAVSIRRESRGMAFLFPGSASFLNMKSPRISYKLMKITLMASTDSVWH